MHMIRPLLVALALAALLLAACGEDEAPAAHMPAAEMPAAAPSATPTQEPGGAGGLPAEPTVTLATPAPTTAPVPEDWPTYTDPTYGYTFDYPATWYLFPPKDSGGAVILYSYDPASIPPEE